MAAERERALAEFRRVMKWVVMAAVAMVAGALIYLKTTGELHLHMVIATVLGVFFSVLLGCGLMAAAFFSSKSGMDDKARDATRDRSGEE